MLGQRRRRWPSNKTALDQCLVRVVGLHLTVPGMRILQLNTSLSVSWRHAQHDSLASMEWMLARTGDGGRMNKHLSLVL